MGIEGGRYWGRRVPHLRPGPSGPPPTASTSPIPEPHRSADHEVSPARRLPTSGSPHTLQPPRGCGIASPTPLLLQAQTVRALCLKWTQAGPRLWPGAPSHLLPLAPLLASVPSPGRRTLGPQPSVAGRKRGKAPEQEGGQPRVPSPRGCNLGSLLSSH